MKRTALLLMAAAALVVVSPHRSAAGSILSGITSARAHDAAVMKHYVEVDRGIWMAVKGERERRQVRFARLIASWSKDQQRVALANGWPTFRYREDQSGRVTEIWSYPGADREYVFQVPSGKLVDQRVR